MGGISHCLSHTFQFGQVLGEMEVPTHVAAQGIVVEAATSYTSYRELWEDKLKLTQVCEDARKGRERV